MPEPASESSTQRESVVSVHQPNFMPWLKLLDKILGSDVYVAYDTVIYTRSEYHGRQQIKRDGRADWLSVPLVKVPGTQQLIMDVMIDNSQPFRQRQLRLIRLAYGKTPYFDEVYPVIAGAYGKGQERLVDLNLDLISALCDYLGSPVRIVTASSLERDRSTDELADNTQRIIDLVRAVGGTVHLTSTYGTARQYIDWPRVQAAGLPVWSQEFDHPVYPQSGADFLPHLAAIDMLFSRGTETAAILDEKRRLVDIATMPDDGD